MGFPPANFQFPTPFCPLLRVRHGTERRTDRQRSSLNNAYAVWGGGIKRIWANCLMPAYNINPIAYAPLMQAVSGSDPRQVSYGQFPTLHTVAQS